MPPLTMPTDRTNPDALRLSALALVLLGGDLDETQFSRVLDIESSSARAIIDTLRTEGSVAEENRLPIDRDASLLTTIGENRLHAVARRLLAYHLENDTLTLAVARTIATTGIQSPQLHEFLCTRAELAETPETVELYAAAARTGRLDDRAVLAYAEACALSGDLDTAACLADSVLERWNCVAESELTAAVRISSSIAAHYGMIDRSADLFHWLSTRHASTDAAVAASVLLVAGRLEEAESILAASAHAAPTAAAAGATLLATGLVQSVTASPSTTLNSLTRAVSVPGRTIRSRMLPDSPAAVTALAAIHCGELAHADAVLARARTSERHWSVTRHRHHVLSAWTSMIRGDLSSARTLLDSLEVSEMNQRDLLFVHGLRVGLARRTGDHAALLHAWGGAQGTLAEYSVDLLSLLPLGELWLTAIRVGDEARIAHLVESARSLLHRLGEPPIWGSALHWYGVQAAILAERPADLLPHARALGEAAEVNTYASGLAVAGRAWLCVLQGTIDVSSVEDAARTLDRIGLPWDGARLAGEAALRTADTRAATALLQLARALRQPISTDSASNAAALPTATSAIALTSREAEVAELLVHGLTYREIGARLFISAKTIEHHVARIRRRLGADSRPELLSMLRALGHGQLAHP